MTLSLISQVLGIVTLILAFREKDMAQKQVLLINALLFFVLAKP